MKTAIVVDYLNQYGGAERVLEEILEIFPESDVYTSFYDPSRIPESSLIHKAKIFPSRLNRIPFIGLITKHFTFLYPFVFKRIDLKNYDLIISSGTIWAKGVTTEPSQLHIFYCHTPPRFLYGYPSETSRRRVWYYKPLVTLLDHILRIWDFHCAQKPTFIIANSENVRRRIKKFYRREAEVIYPPVEIRIRNQESGIKDEVGIYFLVVSRLSAYKNIDIAIRAFNDLKLTLKIVGTGKEENNLKKMAGPGIEFLGFVSDEELGRLYSHCRAFIYTTSDEDFGMTPLEANAFGKPVIAFRSGGITETMKEGETALFFDELTAQGLVEALRKFGSLPAGYWCAEAVQENAGRFLPQRFRREFRHFIEARYNEFCEKKNTGSCS